MYNIVFIRHGATAGNREKRYIGTTDEPLLAESTEKLKAFKYPHADKIYVSPMLRCIETAEIIYKGREYEIIPDLRECDFGIFENKNYLELSENPKYQEWLDSNGKAPFPNGESSDIFTNRCVNAFLNILKTQETKHNTIAIVTHGGTIMAILERLSYIKSSFYDWHVENGNGFEAVFTDKEKLDMVKKLW